MDYSAPWWLPGGDLQTIWASLYARRRFGPAPSFRRERWITPDMDFIDVDMADAVTRLEAAKLAVQASAQVFSSLQQSSLLNVLK